MPQNGQPTPKRPASKQKTWARVVALIFVFCILASLAAVREQRLFGIGLNSNEKAEAVEKTGDSEVINTTDLAPGVLGYGGPVPLEIYLTDGRIDSIHSLPNSETPTFFGHLEEQGLTKAWNGKTLEEAAEMKVDAVSGATYSSKAYIANVRAGVDYALDNKATKSAGGCVTIAQIAAIVVILCGAILPLFIKNRKYRVVQQLCNAGVLGFWAGTFIDYAMMINFFANGLVPTVASFITLGLLVVGLLYPLFGKGAYYCAWMCPYGSLQELAGMIPTKKLRMKPGLVRALDNFRQALWVVLLLLLYIGWGASWIDYEIFTGFIVKSASWTIIGVGLGFLVLSVFTPRPFCRFICPTGSILKDA